MTSNLYADRLDFVLPDFTRVAWVSDQAAVAWKDKMQGITRAWHQVERMSVLSGVRRCYLSVIPEAAFRSGAHDWMLGGLQLAPLQRQGLQAGYRASPAALRPDCPGGVLAVGGRLSDVAEFREAWTRSDHESIGALLGYPACCCRFFCDVWIDQKCVDTTWPMVARALAVDTREARVSGPVEANILWRWMGLRMVPHLPCSFNCEPTVQFGQELRQVANAEGLGSQFELLDEILSWPIEWSALHGIAEIKTPVCKISTRTDATAGRYVVRRHGTSYPPEGARGLGFPYERVTATGPVPIALTSRRRTGSKTAQASQTRAVNSDDESFFRNNGFSSLAAMERLHRPIVALAVQCLEPNGGSLVDLGCGNGALLSKIVLQVGAPVEAVGVEKDPTRLGDSRVAQPYNGGVSLIRADLFDVDAWSRGKQFRLALLAANRLVEVPLMKARAFVARLEETVQDLLFYTYSDTSRIDDQLDDVLTLLGDERTFIPDSHGGESATRVWLQHLSSYTQPQLRLD